MELFWFFQSLEICIKDFSILVAQENFESQMHPWSPLMVSYNDFSPLSPLKPGFQRSWHFFTIKAFIHFLRIIKAFIHQLRPYSGPMCSWGVTTWAKVVTTILKMIMTIIENDYYWKWSWLLSAANGDISIFWFVKFCADFDVCMLSDYLMTEK